MTNSKLSRFTSLIAFGSLAAAASVPAHATMNSSGEIAPWVARAEKAGPVADSKRVAITVYLGFKNEDALTKLVEAQTKPGTAQYGRYLTRAQFHNRFAPEASHVAAVKAALRKEGLSIGHIAASGFYIQATGTVAQIKKAFQVDQDYYKFEGKVLRATAKAPTVPSNIAAYVIHIGGLSQSGSVYRPALATIDRAPNPHPVVNSPADGVKPPPADFLNSPYCSSYWGDHSATVSPKPAPFAAKLPYLVCGYTPAQMKQAYGANKVSFDGTGVTVAIVDAYASPTIVFDVNRYSKNHNLPLLTEKSFQQNLPAGVLKVDPDPLCGQQGWFGEESLDVEAVHSFAPGANILYVGATTCEGDALNDVLYDTIDSISPPDIISNSWSENGEFATPNEQVVNNAQFLQAAAQGISVLFATGDDGDLSQINGVASGSWPGNSPWVTAVGGTTLALTSASGAKQEWGWGTYRAFLGGTAKITSGGTVITASGKLGDFSFYSGAGGGISFYQPQPSYQKGVVPNSISTVTFSAVGEPIFYSEPRRVVPDVAMNADPYTGFLIGETYTVAGDKISDAPCTPYSKTLEYCEGAIGGTSLATPSLAGVLALVNQARHKKGLGPVGFFNPVLYSLKVGASGTNTQAVTDVDAPTTPTALLRAYPASLQENPRVVTVNSQPFIGCPGGICQGVDDVFLTTTKAYDNVTGRGTPWIPSLISALGG